MEFSRKFPLIATLEFPDLSRLTNDLIYHSPRWPTIPAKLLSDIPEFNGNPEEDLSTHVMTYHLWCSSISLNDEYICLQLFQRTLTSTKTKWYVELPRDSFNNFNALTNTFLTPFQIPIHYENGTNILTSLKQYDFTHISDHIHEWML